MLFVSFPDITKFIKISAFLLRVCVILVKKKKENQMPEVTDF